MRDDVRTLIRYNASQLARYPTATAIAIMVSTKAASIFLLNMAERRVSSGTVSYTHLTLPTIYSV